MSVGNRSLRLMAMALALPVVGFAGCAPAADSDADRAGVDRWSHQDWPTGHYRVVEDWPKPLPDDRHSHDGWTWGSMGGVFAETPDRIWLAMRGELPLPDAAEPWTAYGATNLVGNATGNTDGLSATCRPTGSRGWERRFEHSIIVLDGEGNMVEEWPHLDELFSQMPCGRGPHQIKISPYDPDKHVWIIDDQLHVIYRFTQDGELVHTLGELGVRGRGPNTFDRPTDIAWLPDGTYFISDGYGGTRVAKFDANDNFIMDWGSAPADPENPGPGEFRTVHSIAISADRRIFALDRGHARMQVFDENGNFLDMWPLTSPHWPERQNTLMANHLITTDQYIWVGDAPTSRLIKFDLDGNYLYSWGAPGTQAGRLACSHGITTDQDGNLYLADCFAGRVQKFEPIPGADAAKLVGQISRE
jgi:DNA-binding beta-propeller fold protein YncE